MPLLERIDGALAKLREAKIAGLTVKGGKITHTASGVTVLSLQNGDVAKYVLPKLAALGFDWTVPDVRKSLTDKQKDQVGAIQRNAESDYYRSKAAAIVVPTVDSFRAPDSDPRWKSAETQAVIAAFYVSRAVHQQRDAERRSGVSRHDPESNVRREEQRTVDSAMERATDAFYRKYHHADDDPIWGGAYLVSYDDYKLKTDKTLIAKIKDVFARFDMFTRIASRKDDIAAMRAVAEKLKTVYVEGLKVGKTYIVRHDKAEYLLRVTKLVPVEMRGVGRTDYTVEGVSLVSGTSVALSLQSGSGARGPLTAVQARQFAEMRRYVEGLA